MKILTRYNYEKKWTLTSEKELLKIIEDEIGDADTNGTLTYIKEVVKNGKTITVGNCKFKGDEL
jgi:hypothetical protein